MTEESPVTWFDGEDPGMVAAVENAQRTFPFFWREMTWERRRIVPGLILSSVKAPFADADDPSEEPIVEQMWINEIEFDGFTVGGTLLNEPNMLTSVKAGDEVQIPVAQISDWMYASYDERVYGAYTVNYLRSKMAPRHLAEHDEAWGLGFGDPNQVEVMPIEYRLGRKPGFFEKLFGGPKEPKEYVDHPMALNMAGEVKKVIAENPEYLSSQDERGFTMLHEMALGGSTSCVEALLEIGADQSIRTQSGHTAFELASEMGWREVMKMLEA